MFYQKGEVMLITTLLVLFLPFIGLVFLRSLAKFNSPLHYLISSEVSMLVAIFYANHLKDLIFAPYLSIIWVVISITTILAVDFKEALALKERQK